MTVLHTYRHTNRRTCAHSQKTSSVYTVQIGTLLREASLGDDDVSTLLTKVSELREMMEREKSKAARDKTCFDDSGEQAIAVLDRLLTVLRMVHLDIRNFDGPSNASDFRLVVSRWNDQERWAPG
jgi:hypothetical protein